MPSRSPATRGQPAIVNRGSTTSQHSSFPAPRGVVNYPMDAVVAARSSEGVAARGGNHALSVFEPFSAHTVENASPPAEKNNGMGWLAFGVVYSIGYAIVGWLMRGQPAAWSWFRAVALLVPPMTGAVVVFARRQTWRGCQWLFWATIALGLTMSAIGLTGWAADELMFKRQIWLAWPAVFALFGAMAPLFALMAQPHRGVREPLAVTTAVDIAGLAVVTGFLYSFFVIAPDAAPTQGAVASASLRLVSELQQILVFVGLVGATIIGWRTPWRATYRRLALGAFVCLVTLTLSNVETAMAQYQSAFIYDLTWILPFAFYTWAATLAPGSPAEEDDSADS